MKYIILLSLSFVLFPVTAALAQTTIAIENGTPIAVSTNRNAVFSNGYAVVNPPGDNNDTGLVYSRSGDARWTEQGAVNVPGCGWPKSVELYGVFAVSEKYLAVGLACNDPVNSGIAHTFTRKSNNEWVKDTVLEGYSRSWDAFGKSVAISGDTIAVGSNPGGEAGQRGRVTVYSRSDDTWVLEQSIESINTTYQNPDGFGDSIQLSDDFLIVSHFRGSEANADLFQRTSTGWQPHSVISGENFALNQNTLVAAEAGMLRTYSLSITKSWDEVNVIEYPDEQIKSVALGAEYLAVALTDDSKVNLYRKAANDEWQHMGEIDGKPAVPIESDQVFLTIRGISDQWIMVSRNAFPIKSEAISDTYILDIGRIDIEPATDADNQNGATETDIIEANMESWGSGAVDWPLVLMLLVLLRRTMKTNSRNDSLPMRCR